jgi:hypothetical protein
MSRIALLTGLVCLCAMPVAGVTYFVSQSGNEGWDGLTPGSAWKSSDNGDIKGLLAPGGSVLIMPGTYLADLRGSDEGHSLHHNLTRMIFFVSTRSRAFRRMK